MKTRHIIYVAKADLPYTAAGIRIDGIMRNLESLGYSFTVICDRVFDANTQQQALKLGAKVVSNNAEKTEIVYKERTYVYKKEKKSNKLQAFLNLCELRFAKQLFSVVKEYCLQKKASAVILYNDTYALTKRMLRFAPKNGIKLFADVTEWYEKKSRAATIGARMIPKLVDKRICTLDKRLNGVISISPYLHEYYTSIGVKSLFVPPLMPEFYLQPQRGGISTIVYAGSPEGKDLLLPALRAICQINQDEIKLCLKLIGISESDMCRYYGNIDFVKHGIEVYGRLPHADTLQIVDQCDFGILFRQNKRYAKAGFSTKLAECMSRSVPMICNRVGGCEQVITDGVDGFVIEAATEQAIQTIFEKISTLSSDERSEMKNNAHKKACELFGDVTYVQRLGVLMEG